MTKNKYIRVIPAITILLIVFMCTTFQLYAQENQYEIRRKALDAGVYDYSKVKKKNSYKTYYDDEADKKFEEALMSNERLRAVNGFGEYIEQEDGSKVYFREQWAYEYCPELEYVLITGGHGFVSAYDLKTLEEIYTNPSTYVYSPSGKYRFSIFRNEIFHFYIEIKEGEKYVPYLLAESENENYISDVYWADDETLYYLKEKKSSDNSKYWIAYSAKFLKVNKSQYK